MIFVIYKNKKGIKYKLKSNKIFLTFNENDKLVFQNNKNGIIEFSNLKKENKIINYLSIGKSENENFHHYDKDKVNIYIKILVELFLFSKELKEKINSFELNNENKKIVYLINNTCLNKFKSFFEYEELENHIVQSIDNDSIIKIDDLTKNNIIDKIIYGLPEEYYMKIFSKNLNDINTKIDELLFKEFKGKKNLRFLYNYQIINSRILESLKNLELDLQNSIIIAECYFIENQKLLILFENKDIYADEICQIKDDISLDVNYLLEYSKDKISIQNLNNFIFTDFKKLHSDKEEAKKKFDEVNKEVVNLSKNSSAT